MSTATARADFRQFGHARPSGRLPGKHRTNKNTSSANPAITEIDERDRPAASTQQFLQSFDYRIDKVCKENGEQKQDKRLPRGVEESESQ
jgi:hypothetical protein